MSEETLISIVSESTPLRQEAVALCEIVKTWKARIDNLPHHASKFTLELYWRDIVDRLESKAFILGTFELFYTNVVFARAGGANPTMKGEYLIDENLLIPQVDNVRKLERIPAEYLGNLPELLVKFLTPSPKYTPEAEKLTDDLHNEFGPATDFDNRIDTLCGRYKHIVQLVQSFELESDKAPPFKSNELGSKLTAGIVEHIFLYFGYMRELHSREKLKDSIRNANFAFGSMRTLEVLTHLDPSQAGIVQELRDKLRESEKLISGIEAEDIVKWFHQQIDLLRRNGFMVRKVLKHLVKTGKVAPE